MGVIEPTTLALVFVVFVFAVWIYFQVRAMEERLSKLEKEYLALVEELETRIFSR